MQAQGINGPSNRRIYQISNACYRLRRPLGAIFSIAVPFFACVCHSDRPKKARNDQEQPFSLPSPGPEVPPPTKNALIDELVSGIQIDTSDARENLFEFTKEAHPFGSKRQEELSQWLEAKIKKTQFVPRRMAFEATTPNPEALKNPAAPVTIKKEGYNIIASNGYPQRKSSCAVALASHYDTKIVANLNYVGANDGGSSTIALLQVMKDLSERGLDQLKKNSGLDHFLCEIIFIWFDGEEAVLKEWNDGLFNHPAKILDNTYGSRFLASILSNCTFERIKAFCLPRELQGIPLVALIVLDMIGSPQIKIIQDSFSSPWMVTLMNGVAQSLQLESIVEQPPRGIEDDHIPFVRLGVSASDIIDFTNLTYWHAPGDTPDKVSFESITKASKIGLKMALDIASRPKDFLIRAEEKIGN